MTDGMMAADTLRALADDWEDRSCGLYVHLREGSECRWGVNWFSHGSVSEILREIADRAREEQADLKMFAERVHGMLWADGWHDLDEIADRLEEELSELDRMRCTGEMYRVNSEDYAAAMWVREHGGLDKIRRQRRDSVPRAAYERNLAKRQRQVDESQAALRRRSRWIAELEHLLCKEMSYSLRRDAGCLAPEALDADGVEIRVGDTVWHVETGEQCKVVEVDSRSVSVDFRVDGDGTKHTGSILPANLTHRAPVLAADGKPLREGETVYKVGGDGTAYVFDGMSDNVDGLAMLHHDGKPYIGTGLRVDQLTHERPDTWERLMDDATQPPWYYCRQHGVETDAVSPDADLAEVVTPFAQDLVRRARALTERGER